jgi:hypothetical protein
VPDPTHSSAAYALDGRDIVLADPDAQMTLEVNRAILAQLREDERHLRKLSVASELERTRPPRDQWFASTRQDWAAEAARYRAVELEAGSREAIMEYRRQLVDALGD